MIRVRPSVLAIQAYSARPGGGYLRLDLNENIQGPSPKVREALKTIDTDIIAQYGNDAVVNRAVAEHFGVKPEQLVLTNGSVEGITFSAQLVLEDGDEVPMFEPAYHMYHINVKKVGARIKSYFYNDDFTFPIEDLKRALKARPKYIILGSPNNPTGTPIPDAEVWELVQKYPETLFVIDEAYAEFTAQSMLSRAVETENMLVLRTFSKVYGLAGLRLGAMFGHEETLNLVKKIRFPHGINTISLALLQVAIQDEEYVQKSVAEIIEAKAWTMDQLKGMANLGVDTFHCEGNFILVNVGDRIHDVVQALKERGILVRNRNSDPLLKGFFRLTIGPRDAMQRFITVFRDIVS